jgi:hypothetical protein
MAWQNSGRSVRHLDDLLAGIKGIGGIENWLIISLQAFFDRSGKFPGDQNYGSHISSPYAYMIKSISFLGSY